MPYAQKNYLEVQGIKHPTKQNFRISQIGCFLTSFCNLLERFGKGVDPLKLNAYFRDNSVYIDVDDGIRDDLNYGAITRYNGNIVMSRSGTGAPKTNNCIVKFSGLASRFGTHFCLVADASKGLIIDSWDGKVKSWNEYGGPKTWAEYVDNTPPPPVPEPPKPVEAPIVAPPSDIITIKVQSGWGLSHVLKAAGYSKEQWENPAEWQRLSALNGAPNGLRLKVGMTVKVFRSPIVAIQPPAPAPIPAPIPEPVAPATPAVIEPPKPVEEKVEVQLLPSDPKAYQSTFVEEDKIYIAKDTIDVLDIDGLHIARRLVKGQRVYSGGRFVKKSDTGEDIVYIRTKKSVLSGVWYGVPLKALSDGQDSKSYVGPLGNDPDDDNEFNLDIAKEMRELASHLSSREKLIALIAKVQGFFLNIVRKIKK